MAWDYLKMAREP